MKCVKVNLSYSNWHQTALWKTAARILISVILLSICSIPYNFVSVDVPETEIWKLYLIKFFLPTFLTPLILFAFGRVIFLRLGLVNEKSIGGIFDPIDMAVDEELTEDESSSSHGSGKGGSLEFQEMEAAQRV